MEGNGRLVVLSSPQVAGLAETAERWTRAGLSTERADRARAERALDTIYRTAGRRPPARVVWCGSPLSMEVARAMALGRFGPARERRIPPKVLDAAREAAEASRGVRPGAALAEVLRRGLQHRVADAVRDRLGDEVHLRVTACVRKAVERRVEVSVGFPVADSLESALGGPPGPALYGQHEAGWLAYYDFLFECTPLRRATARLRGLWELARAASWAAPHEGICWVAERPERMERDGRGRLHGARGPALRFPDGWEIRAQEGIVVPPAVPSRIAS